MHRPRIERRVGAGAILAAVSPAAAPGGVLVTVAGLSSCFHSDLFISPLESRDKDAVIEELVDCLVKSGRVRNRDVILNTVRERERTWTTAIGKGVAVPHGRSLVVRELTVLFANCPEGIPFGADDGEPVRLFFFIVAPYQDKGNRYLPVLGSIVELVAKDEIREQLLAVSTFDELARILDSGV
jgi:mannitol/fructose-specific phosphotransferase system IIA component (Ntr-type)